MTRVESAVQKLEAVAVALQDLAGRLSVANQENSHPEGTQPRPFLLTINEAARELRIGRSKVYQLIKRGELRKFADGGRMTRITRDSVQAFIRRHSSRYSA